MTYRSIMLTFTPALQCSVHGCQRITTRGQLSIMNKDRELSPVCEEHGLMFSCDQAEQYASVERFVTWVYGGHGVARLLSSCPVDSVPGYEYDVNSPYTDEAWLVEYIGADGQLQRLYVVWYMGEFTFELYDYDEERYLKWCAVERGYPSPANQSAV